MSLMNNLCLENLAFERDDVPLFEGVSAEWTAGSIIQLSGHNGCGKTTLMRVIAGLQAAASGRAVFNGHATHRFETRAQLLYLGHHVGVKLTLTPEENLRWFFALHGLKGDAHAAAEPSRDELQTALAKVGLHAHRDFPCYQLSAGQQRRVALARLYLSQAPLWLLDEPFTAIDVDGVAQLEQQIEAHARRGGIVLLTSHQAWQAHNLHVFNLEHFKPRFARSELA